MVRGCSHSLIAQVQIHIVQLYMIPNERRLLASKLHHQIVMPMSMRLTSKSGQNASRPVITRGNIDDDAALLRRIDVNITSFDNPMT